MNNYNKLNNYTAKRESRHGFHNSVPGQTKRRPQLSLYSYGTRPLNGAKTNLSLK